MGRSVYLVALWFFVDNRAHGLQLPVSKINDIHKPLSVARCSEFGECTDE